MMLVFLGVCMCITFFVLQTYITSGFHAREHRLLPLVLTLVALYNFYRIVQEIMGSTSVFRALTDLLVIQMVYVLFHYVMDFMHFKLKVWLETLLFLVCFFRLSGERLHQYTLHPVCEQCFLPSSFAMSIFSFVRTLRQPFVSSVAASGLTG